MAAITVSTDSSQHFKRFYGTGTANQADTLTSTVVASHRRQRLVQVTAVYSGAPTQTGVIITIDSGISAAHDVTLHTGSADVRYTIYTPDEDIFLMPGDAILINLPAAGGVVTASATILVEEF